MITTLQIDSMGSLHAWEGDVAPYRKSGLLYTVNGKEAPLFMDREDDIQTALGNLTEDEIYMLNKGYPVTTSNFPGDYFLLD